LSTLLGINTQTRHLRHLSPGYNPEGIVIFYNLNEQIIKDYQALSDRLVNLPGVEAVAASGHFIGEGYSGQGIRRYGDQPNQSQTINEYRIHPGLCNLYQFNLKFGRFFDPDRIPDRSCIILNEAAVQMFGSSPEEIVGESMVRWEDPMEVIGVVEDFYYTSAAKEVEPLMLTAYSERIRNIPIRIASETDVTGTLELINETIKSFDPDYIMMTRFASDIWEGYYSGEKRLTNIVGVGSILSMVIVLLGIFALVSHNINRRTKEIGIRKVMGGSTGNMLVLIYKSTLKWTVIAAGLAIPLSWLYLNNWLHNYAVRIPLNWWIFAGSILLVIILETAITLGQTWKTARKDPVEALRYE
jgi:putative ABC transport system permease protein